MLLLLPLLALAAEPDATPVAARMAEHVTLGRGLHDAVIQGDTDRAGELAARLASLTPEGLPLSLHAGLAELSEEAGRVGAAPDAAQVATAVSQVLGACAGCHDTTGSGPKLTDRSVPPASWAADGPMPQHQWAADWLFAGLIANDDAGWQRGAKALAEAPILAADTSRPEGFDVLEGALRSAAVSAQAAAQPGARVAAYGAVLGTCARCHTLMEGEAATPR